MFGCRSAVANSYTLQASISPPLIAPARNLRSPVRPCQLANSLCRKSGANSLPLSRPNYRSASEILALGAPPLRRSCFCRQGGRPQHSMRAGSMTPKPGAPGLDFETGEPMKLPSPLYGISTSSIHWVPQVPTLGPGKPQNFMGQKCDLSTPLRATESPPAPSARRAADEAQTSRRPGCGTPASRDRGTRCPSPPPRSSSAAWRRHRRS